MATKEESRIEGIKVENIQWLIEIIRKKYSVVKQGTKYLETSEREYDLTALSNIRDFLSHIETAFRVDVSDKECEQNINQSEEHLRRALVESHQTALESRLDKFLEEYECYEKEMLPNEKLFGIDNITDHSEIRKDLRHIQNLLSMGRKQKGTNIWNEEWEEGVQDFVNGYELTVKLQERIKHYKEIYYRHKFQYEKDAENKIAAEKNKKIAVALGILGIFATIIVAFLFSNTGETLINYILNIPANTPPTD